MIGLGTLINTGSIVAGGLLGRLFGRFLQIRHQESLNMACGVSVLFIGVAGAMQGMLSIDGSSLSSAMAIVGAIQDGILGDYSILAVKSILDLIIIVVMTCSMGKGCAFSAIPVCLFEGTITLLAKLIRPIMTEAALQNISLIGSILIFCVGLNLVWGKKVRVANMLPAVILAVIAAFLPIGL